MNELHELPMIRQTQDDYPALMALAKELVTTGFLPVAIKTPAQAVAIILTGRELGLPAMQSLRSICIIQGKPELSADLQLSIFHRDGGRSKWVALDATKAALWLRHPNGDEHTETFTIEDAKRAGLAGGVNWQKYPKAMLRSRAITAGLKSIGFEPLTGTYAPGEIGGPEIVSPEPETVVEVEPEAPAPPPEPVKPKAPTKAEASKVATANTRAYVLDLLGATEEGEARANLTGYLRAAGWLDADKEVEQWPYRFVPITKEEIEALKVALGEFALNGTAVKAYQPHGMDPAALQSQPVKEVKPEKKNGWADFLMPFGKDKGTALGKIPVEKLKYYCDTFTVRESMTVQQPDGSELVTPYAPEIVKQQKDLRAALDVAAKELSFTK